MQARTVFAALSAGAVVTLLASAPAQAQSLGTFTWQLQPFCNKVVVTVTQNGGLYTIDGYDDQCGAPQRAPLVGLATPNPDGTIGFGLNIVTVPGGRNVHVDARIDLGTLGGPWSDSAGNTGTFVLGGAAAGSARPAPTVPGSVLAVGSVAGTAITNNSITSTQIQNNSITSASTSNEPGISGNFVSTPTAVSNTPTSVVSTAMRVPANGFVKIEVTGDWQPGTAGIDSAVCQLQKGAVAAVDSNQPRFYLNDRNTASSGLSGFSGHRILSVLAADNPFLTTTGQNFRLVCDLLAGAVSIDNVFVSATYYASSYEPVQFVLPFDTTPPAAPPTPQQ